MRLFKQCFHFLGSIQFAIILITVTAFMVIAATCLESMTQSHLFAAKWIYDHVVFAVVLALFFVNILFSSLRRYPFQKRHIPFLMTHLGLLMIIAGVAIKNAYGIQGYMLLYEGCASNRIVIPQTEAVLIETLSNGQKESLIIPLQRQLSGQITLTDHRSSPIQAELVSYYPHSQERYRHWTMHNKAHLYGIPSLDLIFIEESDALDEPIRIKWHPLQEKPVAVFPLKAKSIKDILNKAVSTCQLTIIDLDNQEACEKLSLNELINKTSPSFILDYFNISIEITTAYPDQLESVKVCFRSIVDKDESKPQPAYIDLLKEDIPNPLYLQAENKSLAIELHSEQKLFIVEDSHHVNWLILLSPSGKIQWQRFTHQIPDSVIAFEKGFAGYFVSSKISPEIWPTSQHEWKQVERFLTCILLKQRFEEISTNRYWSLLQNACNQSNQRFEQVFAEWILYLKHCQQASQQLPLPKSISKVFQCLDFTEIPYAQFTEAIESAAHMPLWSLAFSQTSLPEVYSQRKQLLGPNEKMCLLLSWLNLSGVKIDAYFPNLAQHPQQLKDIYRLSSLLMLYCAKHRYAFTEPISKYDFPKSFHPIIEYLAHWFGKNPNESTDLSFALLLTQQSLDLTECAHYEWFQWMNLYNEWDNSIFWQTFNSDEFKALAPLHLEFSPLPPISKIEEATPLISLNIVSQHTERRISLRYDRHCTGLKWPLLGSNTILRFQPKTLELPWSIRLRDARQYNYPGKNQACSYECDLLLSPMTANTTIPHRELSVTLSMNQVYETDDGYRFFLSNISPAQESEVQKVQLIVNYDPAKFYLTYPGAFCVFLGIILLCRQQIKKIRAEKIRTIKNP